MGARRIMTLSAAAAAIASTALGGCALLSGASDLTIGDPEAGEEEPRDARAAGDVAVVDSAGRGDSATDASADAPVDSAGSGGRIKDITFENNSLTHPTSGADEIIGAGGDLSIADGAQAISGAYSMQTIGEPSYLKESFVPVTELFISFLIEVDAVSSNGTVNIARILTMPANESVDISIGNGASRNLIVSNAGLSVGGGSVPADEQTYRIGLHFTSGNGNGRYEVFVTTKNGVFGAPIASSTVSTIGSMVGFQLGLISGAGSAFVFDDIRLDTKSMP